MSNTVELIKQDHRKVEQLFSQYRDTKEPDIVDQICTELKVHAQLEENLLYPLLRKDVNEQDAQHAQEEHDEAKQLIEEIENSGVEGEQLTALVEKLEKAVSHHVKEEESEILPEMEAQVGDQLVSMFDEVVARKVQLLEQEEDDEEMVDLAKAELRERVAAMSSESS